MKQTKNITLDEAMKHVSYDNASGLFTRNKNGKLTGYFTTKGYIHVYIGGTEYLGHKLAWLFEYGEYPEFQIDHKNRVRADNRICNLRSSSASLNMKNKKKYKSNKSGVCGVRRRTDNRKWNADIRVNGKLIALGCFDEFADAVVARKHAELIYKFDETHGID